MFGKTNSLIPNLKLVAAYRYFSIAIIFIYTGSCSGDYGGGNFNITPLSEAELFKLKSARIEGEMKQLEAMGFSK